MAWRVARCLLALRDQIDAAFPGRDKASDGTIGDEDHQNRDSDHNPWCGPGVVTALDITHDPGNGVDIDQLTDELQAGRDPRIKYVIANRLIMSGEGGPSPWVWRTYNGSNPHTRHFHLSVVCGSTMDDNSPWELPSLEEADMPTADEIARAVWATKLRKVNEKDKRWRARTLLEWSYGHTAKARSEQRELAAVVASNAAAIDALAKALAEHAEVLDPDAFAAQVREEAEAGAAAALEAMPLAAVLVRGEEEEETA